MGEKGIRLFKNSRTRYYPDFYCLNSAENMEDGFVLDAKYKRLGNYDDVAKVGPDDIHQVIAYIVALKAGKGGFISPLESKQSSIPTKKIKNISSTLSIFGIEICKTATSYAEFCDKMKENENDFLSSLNLRNDTEIS